MVGAALALPGARLDFLVDYSLETIHERRQQVIQAANAVGTAQPRAGFRPGHNRTGSRRLLKEHADLHLRMHYPIDGSAVPERSLQIQDHGNDSAETLADDGPLPKFAVAWDPSMRVST